MEYRKLIQFGKNSHVISLPKSWLQKNNLSKGDTIHLDESEEGLLLRPNEVSKKEEVREITLDITGKDKEDIIRRINTYYLNNFQVIRIVGKNLQDHTVLVKNTIHNLAGLEILEQTPSLIMARDFLNINDVSIRDIFRKIDIIVRTMLTDSRKTLHEDLYDNINIRDEDVNRLTFLIQRTIKNALANPSVAKSFGMGSIELLQFLESTLHLEIIGDETKRIAKCLRKINLSEKAKKELDNLYLKIEKNYLEVMKAYYNKDKDLAYLIATKKSTLMKECDNFYQKYGGNKITVSIAEKLKNMIYSIHVLSRKVYQ